MRYDLRSLKFSYAFSTLQFQIHEGDEMKVPSSIATLVVVLLCSVTSLAQGLPKPGPEYDVFKHDVGTWDVEIKTPQGPATQGVENNRMLGGFWMLADFRGKLMGLDFKGHGVYGYDAEKKQYVGTWIDSLSSAKNGHGWKVRQGSSHHDLRRNGSRHGR